MISNTVNHQYEETVKISLGPESDLWKWCKQSQVRLMVLIKLYSGTLFRSGGKYFGRLFFKYSIFRWGGDKWECGNIYTILRERMITAFLNIWHKILYTFSSRINSYKQFHLFCIFQIHIGIPMTASRLLLLYVLPTVPIQTYLSCFKGAVSALTRALAIDEAKYNVRVNS